MPLPSLSQALTMVQWPWDTDRNLSTLARKTSSFLRLACNPAQSVTNGKMTHYFQVLLYGKAPKVMSSTRDPGRVLSIQSHVTFGYVGGKAAVFPLQCLGYDVDVVNTVNYSNHAGYGRSGGTKTSAAELASLFESMEDNELLIPGRLLTGFIPGAEALSAVANLATKLRKEKPDLIYLLDPVMGDAGKLYVHPDVIPIYQRTLPLATVITPNWFETEILTKTKLKDLPSLRYALKVLHEEYHVPNVVISSIPLREWLVEALPLHFRSSIDSDSLLCLSSASSTNLQQTQDLSVIHTQCVPLIPGYFSGVGDLFSALLLAHFDPNNSTSSPLRTPVSLAASQALTKTHAILRLTDEYVQSLPEEERQPTDDEKDTADLLRKTRRMRGRELRLVQGQDIIRGVGHCELRQMEHWATFWEQ